MTEYVFRPLRNGKRARLFYGRYALNRGDTPVTVALGTPDKIVARKRLRDLIVEKQREAEGIIAPRAQREAAGASLVSLLTDYITDIRARRRSVKHAADTEQRIAKMLRETGWRRLADIRADQFVKWRATLTIAPKTVREYQAAINAFLNWLVRLDRIARNPLSGVDVVSIRGKHVRLSRAFTSDEISRLLSVAPERNLPYLMLTYTGQRLGEVRALVWGDLHLDDARPRALFRAETTKDADKRALPLHPRLAQVLIEARPAGVAADAPVFPTFPDRHTLLRDMEKAGIPRCDATGRVLHFHSFRKTFQTMGVIHGINQRSAQEMLGHSDANLTARVYTDVAALELHTEIAKLPWLGEKSHVAVKHTLLEGFPRGNERFRSLCLELLSFSETIEKEELTELGNPENWRARRDSNEGADEGAIIASERVGKFVSQLVAAIRTLKGEGEGEA